MKANRSVC